MGEENLKNITQEAINLGKKALEENNSSGSAETQETKKRGRKKIEDMTEEERQKYEEEKRIKAEKKAEEKRLAEMGLNVDLTNNNTYISIELSKEFIAKCKKEKISADDYENIFFALMKKFSDGEIELKKRIKTEFY